MKDNGYLSGVIAIYGSSGDHDPMVGGRDATTGYKTKGALREVYIHSGVVFFVSLGLMETCSTLWRSHTSDPSVNLVGVAALSWMKLTVVLFK